MKPARLSAAKARPSLKTTAQVRAIFGLARKAGHGDDQRREVIAAVTLGAKHSAADLTFDEANAVIRHYRGRTFTPAPRRTVQHRRRRAGIKQIVSPAQLQLIADLASQREWTVDSLKQICSRMHVPFPLRTTDDANKIIEALKSMNRRDNLWAA